MFNFEASMPGVWLNPCQASSYGGKERLMITAIFAALTTTEPDPIAQKNKDKKNIFFIGVVAPVVIVAKLKIVHKRFLGFAYAFSSQQVN
jgi:hypothetical protein